MVEAEYTLIVEDPNGNEYTLIGFIINEPGQSPAYGTVEGLAFIGEEGEFPPIGVPLTVMNATEGPAGSAKLYSAYATPPCFLAGTQIDTPDDPRPVDQIAAGDLVTTRDHGAQPVLWVGRRIIDRATSGAFPALRPIRIRRDAFGRGTPRGDLLVSPQHRILLSGWRAELFCGQDEVLATESFRPGPETLAGLEPLDRRQLLALRPDLVSRAANLAVRPLIRAREAEVCAV